VQGPPPPKRGEVTGTAGEEGLPGKRTGRAREPRFFGLAFRVSDLNVPTGLLGATLSPARDARQGKGRRIATLRGRDLDISPAIVFIT